MITEREYLALLADAQRIKQEAFSAAPGMELDRLRELLALTPPAYSLIMTRLIIFDGLTESKGELGPESIEELKKQIFKRLWRHPLGRVALGLVLVGSLAFTIWKSLPERVQDGFFKPPLSLVVTVETAGPVEIRPGGEAAGRPPVYTFPLGIRLTNPSGAPVRLESGQLLLGARPEPYLAGFAPFRTSLLGAHVSRQESLRVELVPLRPEALPTGARIPGAWLQLTVVGADEQEANLIYELGPQAIPSGTQGASPPKPGVERPK